VLAKQKTMKVYCKTCGLPLTNELTEYTGKSFGEAEEQPFVQKGSYTISDGNFFTGTVGNVIANVEDMVNIIDHFNKGRLNGCCGLDGTDGINKLCANGHEVATEKSDCWMPTAVIFEKEKIILK
jgi:hypothetical protein